MSNVDTARKSWGGKPPEWVIALAELCDRTSQNRAAVLVGYSATAVGQVIHKKYPSRIDRIERAVRGALLAQTVECPVLGEITSNTCIEYQRQKFAPTNSMRVRLYKACRNGCPNFKG